MGRAGVDALSGNLSSLQLRERGCGWGEEGGAEALEPVWLTWERAELRSGDRGPGQTLEKRF